ncbi:MAG: hypothetical protein JHD15_23855 [Phenylobacterium sp.]|jgi:hypothetical protein|uniref:hypothetical protein n=1 Tax=Phenylobacterium sp. RIFCSPHIGHO2_01_FULL_69_31 TaxID=1801944 RepID=UPI000B2D2B05|nr:hypothetical protein [Phenylobacterium sp. RIFCSPHIGHO2_01_FULL_69_31]MBJ7413371.1 hypothetical protein [Phenylobacterium sp.]
MRKLLIGVAFSLAIGGTAAASDYIVVNSTDPGFKRGQAFDAGAKVALGAGKTLTLMRATGEVVTLRGAAAGATVPGARMAAADSARFETLRSLVEPPPTGRTFGARRGGICPAAETLTSLDDIVRTAESSGCKTVARQALDAYLAKGATSNN